MGASIRNIGRMLGISHGPELSQNSPLMQPQQAAPGFGMPSLLGQASDGSELPPVSAQPAMTPAPAVDPMQAPEDTADMTVQGSRMSPEALGMPQMPRMVPASPQSIDEMRQALKAKEQMARQLYHKNSEFGTSGLLRDVIGNVSDFGRRLLGFAPRYNEEKWMEKAYGMTSEDPAVAAAAREQAMQYNPDRTMTYAKRIDEEQSSNATSQSMAEYRRSQAADRDRQALSGLGAGLARMAQGRDLGVVDAQYQRMLPAIQAKLDAVYGKDVVKAPQQYDPAFVDGLTTAGYGGNTVQRAEAAALSADVRMEIAKGRNMTAKEIALIGADARRYAADQAYRATVNRLAIMGMPIQTITQTDPTGGIVMPGELKVQTVVRAPPVRAAGAEPQSGPPVGYVNPNGMRFKGGDWKNKNNWVKVK